MAATITEQIRLPRLMPLEANGCLKAVYEQAKNRAHTQTVPPESQGEFFQWFTGLQSFKDIYLEMVNKYSASRSPSELEVLNKQTAGAIFQIMAARFLEAALKQRELLPLSPGSRISQQACFLDERDSLALLKKLYHTSTTVDQGSIFESLLGISADDGMIVEPTPRGNGCTILTVCEATAANQDEGYYEDKYKAFRYRVDDFRVLFHDQPFLLFLVPTSTNPYMRQHKPDDVEFIDLPVSRGQLGGYYRAFKTLYRADPDHPTLEERQNRARYQYNRALDRLLEAKLAGYQGREQLPRSYRDDLVRYIERAQPCDWPPLTPLPLES